MASPTFLGDGHTPRRSDALWAIEQKILGALTDGGGGTGGGTIQVYENRDPAAPDDPNEAALSFPTGGGTLTQWSVSSQAWV